MSTTVTAAKVSLKDRFNKSYEKSKENEIPLKTWNQAKQFLKDEGIEYKKGTLLSTVRTLIEEGGYFLVLEGEVKEAMEEYISKKENSESL